MCAKSGEGLFCHMDCLVLGFSHLALIPLRLPFSRPVLTSFLQSSAYVSTAQWNELGFAPYIWQCGLPLLCRLFRATPQCFICWTGVIWVYRSLQRRLLYGWGLKERVLQHISTHTEPMLWFRCDIQKVRATIVDIAIYITFRGHKSRPASSYRTVWPLTRIARAV